MEKHYLEIREILKKNKLENSVSIDIVLAVESAIGCSGHTVTEEEYETICAFTRCIWNEVDKTYTQLLADIVVDCLWHCYNFYQCAKINLTFEDMNKVNACNKEYDKILKTVIMAYLDKYYED